MPVRLIAAILSMYSAGALAAKGTAPTPDPWGAVIFVSAVGLFIAWFIWQVIRENRKKV
jgi:hypothetical protein